MELLSIGICGMSCKCGIRRTQTQEQDKKMNLEAEAEKIHREAIVIDATCPLATFDDHFERWISGGATVIAPTLSFPSELTRQTLTRMGEWYAKLRRYEDKLLHVLSVEDIYRAKEEQKLGVLFHFQGTTPFETDINNVEIFHRLGIRMVQLTYNVKDFVGDGCAERTDCGLSAFGVKVVGELNRLGIVVDCAHTGYQTTMDAIEASEKPVIISHGNVRAVCDNSRNLSDDTIRAVAGNGGVIGMNGYPAFVARKARPQLEDLLDHVDHIAKLVGVEHISVGIDYFIGQAGIASDEQAKAAYERRIREGAWNPRDYPPPPWHYPEGIEIPEKLPNLTAGLLKRGYSEAHVKMILGLNLVRVFKETW